MNICHHMIVTGKIRTRTVIRTAEDERLYRMIDYGSRDIKGQKVGRKLRWVQAEPQRRWNRIRTNFGYQSARRACRKNLI